MLKLKTFNVRKFVLVSYFVGLFVYIVIGFLPAEAAHYDISAALSIPSISLNSDVTTLELEDHKLNTPDTIVGSYSRHKNKTLLIGHSTTVFGELDKVSIGDEIIYNGTKYNVVSSEFYSREEINMNELLLAAKKDTIVLMTCAGIDLGNGNYSHRIIVVATV